MWTLTKLIEEMTKAGWSKVEGHGKLTYRWQDTNRIIRLDRLWHRKPLWKYFAFRSEIPPHEEPPF